MKNLSKTKKGLLLGITLIIIAILIGIIFRHDIAFIFAGIGTIIIGITTLMYLNKDDK
jgi:uncharacterized membrane protein YkgB